MLCKKRWIKDEFLLSIHHSQPVHHHVLGSKHALGFMGIHPKMAILIMGYSGYVNPYQWTHLSPERTLGANLLGALVEDNLIAKFAPMATCRDPSQRATGQPKNDPEKMATSG